jgi:SAM-dependent methyltransferase
MSSKCICCLNGKIERSDSYRWNLWDAQYALAVCKNCGSAFTDPLPSDTALTKFYRECMRIEWFRDHYAFKIRDARERFRHYRSFLGNSVLDFGGNLGYFSQACREFGLRAETYDPYVASTNSKVTRSWDTVVALHVLEHANDPNTLLSEMKQRLVPGGKLILAVPNFHSAGYSIQKMNWVWAQPPLPHIFHFTERGLSALLERHGFSVTGVEYSDRWDANHLSDVKCAPLFRRLHSRWGKQKSAWGRKAVSFLNGHLRGLAYTISKAFPREKETLAELQVYAVCNQ